jgi:predicted secreted protein
MRSTKTSTNMTGNQNKILEVSNLARTNLKKNHTATKWTARQMASETTKTERKLLRRKKTTKLNGIKVTSRQCRNPLQLDASTVRASSSDKRKQSDQKENCVFPKRAPSYRTSSQSSMHALYASRTRRLDSDWSAAVVSVQLQFPRGPEPNISRSRSPRAALNPRPRSC